MLPTNPTSQSLWGSQCSRALTAVAEEAGGGARGWEGRPTFSFIFTLFTQRPYLFQSVGCFCLFVCLLSFFCFCFFQKAGSFLAHCPICLDRHVQRCRNMYIHPSCRFFQAWACRILCTSSCFAESQNKSCQQSHLLRLFNTHSQNAPDRGYFVSHSCSRNNHRWAPHHFCTAEGSDVGS